MRFEISSLFLSVFIPFYNEEKRLQNSAETVYAYLSNKFPSDQFELLLVNDGSSDNSLAIAQEFAEALLKRSDLPSSRLRRLGLRSEGRTSSDRNVRIISHEPPNRGKGWAVREGMLGSKGDWVLFLDCDLATPIEEFDKFLPHLDGMRSHLLRRDAEGGSFTSDSSSGAGATSPEIPDVIIGTRRIKESQIKIRQPFYREFAGKVFYYLAKLILGLKVSDVTCGFKSYSRRAINQIFPRQKLLDWSYDAEDLFLAQKFGFRIKEIPVFWQDKNQSRVRVLKDAVESLRGLLKIKISGAANKDYDA